MAELKTKQNNTDISEFVNSFADTEEKRKDSFELINLMRDFRGFEPKMWSLNKMERTEGEPDVVGHDKITGEFSEVHCFVTAVTTGSSFITTVQNLTMPQGVSVAP